MKLLSLLEQKSHHAGAPLWHVFCDFLLNYWRFCFWTRSLPFPVPVSHLSMLTLIYLGLRVFNLYPILGVSESGQRIRIQGRIDESGNMRDVRIAFGKFIHMLLLVVQNEREACVN